MFRKCLYLVLLAALSSPLNSAQTCLTSNEFYYYPVPGAQGKIYYVKSGPGKWNLWRMNPDGTSPEKLTDDSSIVSSAFDISQDKTKIAVIKITETGSIVTLMNADGSSAVNVYSGTLLVSEVKISPDNSKVAFAATDEDGGNGTLYLVDALGSGLRMLSDGVSPAKPLALAGNIAAFDIQGSTLTKNITSAFYPIAFSSDSTKIFFSATDNSYDYLASINTDGTNLKMLATDGNYPLCLKSGKVIFRSGSLLVMMNPDGTGMAPLYFTPGYTQLFGLSPDESRIAVAVTTTSYPQYSFEIVVVSTSGALIKEISLVNRYIVSASWISDIELAYWDLGDMAANRACSNIFTINADGTNPVNITNNTTRYPNLIIAGGNRIIYSEDTQLMGNNGQLDIYSMDLSGNKTALMTLGDGQTIYDALLSPDGGKLLYSLYDENAPNNFGLFLRNTDGTGPPALLEENNTYGYSLGDDRWSPAGDRCIFQSAIDFNDYYLVNADGTGKQAIIPANSLGGEFMFSPDGSEIAFLGLLYDTQSLNRNIYITDLSAYRSIFSSDHTGYDILDWKLDKILFTSYYDNAVYVINTDGTGQQTAINELIYIMQLSPDNTTLAYSMGTSTINPSGFYLEDISAADISASRRKIMDETPFHFMWSSDGKNIIYTENFKNLYSINTDTLMKTNLNPRIYMLSNFYSCPNNMMVYYADYNIWAGDLGSGVIVIPPGRKAYSYPNPCRLSVNGALTIAGNYVPNGEIKIFTLSGKLVKVLNETSGGSTVTWDGTNQSNQKVANGLYVYTTSNTSGRASGKVAVVR